MTHDIINGGIAALADNSDGTLVNGVALGENDITQGMSGKRTRWPKETLEEAADLLVGKPITENFGEGHVAAEKTDEGVQVSPDVPVRSVLGEVTDARYEDGVGLLWQGELKDEEMTEKVEQGLAEVSPVMSRDLEPVEGDEGLFEATKINAFRDLGIVRKGASPSNSIEPGAAAAMTAEALASAFDEPAESGTETRDDDDPSGGEGQSTGATGLGSYMDAEDITDAEFELLASSRQMDSPTVIEQEDAEKLPEANELLSAASECENALVVDEDEYETLKDNTETVRGVLEEALCERTELKESTVEALSFEALAGEFENEEGEFDVEALVQEPETGDISEEEEVEALSDDDAARIEEIDSKIAALGSVLPQERIEALQSEACELADTDEYAEIEVLN